MIQDGFLYLNTALFMYSCMDSVISTEQLDMLLGNMRNSISVDKVIKSVQQTYKMNTLEKNSFYHGILEIIKNSNNSRDAALNILQTIEELLRDKSSTIIQEMETVGSEMIDPQNKQSPIFRRVG